MNVAEAMDAARPHVLAIVGPTAVGKTTLAVRLGQRLGGEVISADSRQVYRHMDIGTAKASVAEQAALPHHLLDIVEPNEELTLAHYQRLAWAAIEAIWSRGRVPVLVGGTGLYVKAVIEGWTVPEVPPDQDLRERLYAEAQRLGPEALHRQLAAVDPAAAQRIDVRNVRRVIRALEVYQQTGRPISQLQQKSPPPYRFLKIGLTMPRQELYRRIDERIERMMAQGLEAEVRWLVTHGYRDDLPAMSGLGYQQISQYLRGEITLEEAVALIKHHTRRFVRQQYNWFRLSDSTIHWFDVVALDEQGIYELVAEFLEGTRKRVVAGKKSD